METSAIGFSAASEGATKSSARELSDQFLTLLVAQLKNQDPTKPIENDEFVTQLAQLQALDQQQTLAETNQSLLLQSSLSTGAALIDKEVRGFAVVNGERVSVTGDVKSIKVEDGAVVYSVSTESGTVPMHPNDVVEVTPKS